MANFVILRHPVTILFKDFTNPDILTNDDKNLQALTLGGPTRENLVPSLDNQLYIRMILKQKSKGNLSYGLS